MARYSIYPRRKRSRKLPLGFVALSLIAIIILANAFFKISIPAIKPHAQPIGPLATSSTVNVPHLNYGQYAVGAEGFGVLKSSAGQAPRPTASVAKVMTALAVLKEHPLEPGETGQMIKITDEYEALFGKYWSKNGTSVKLDAGTEISQYEAMRYMLIPSANNVADILALWAFGSMESYRQYANDYAQELGLESSHFADASGFSPQTVSTADDLVELGRLAMQNPLLREIVATWQISLPDGHKAQNSNVFLDYKSNGVIGIKTGDTDQAKGVYLFAAEEKVGQQKVTIIGAVMGAKSLFKAQQDAMKLLKSARQGFKSVQVVDKGQILARYRLPWGGSVKAVAPESVLSVAWGDKVLEPHIEFKKFRAPKTQGDDVGTITLPSADLNTEVPLRLSDNIEAPSFLWQLRLAARGLLPW